MTKFDEEVDFVIVGSGGGSLCAALYLHARGKKVVVLEKADVIGGTTARSGGVMWIPNNTFMQRDGIADSFEQAATYLDGLAADQDDAPGSTPERRHTYLREAPEMVEFLLDQGIKLDRVTYWPDYYDERPGGHKQSRCVVADIFNINELGEWKKRMAPGFLEMPASLEEAMSLPNFKRSWAARKILFKVIGRVIGQLLTGKRFVSAGKALQGRMLQVLLREGIDIRPQTPVTALVEEGGVIRGVVAEQGGQARRIAGRLGVLVGAGGFSHNRRMREQYQPGTSIEWSSAPLTDTGEMIEEMMRCGAATAQMEEMVGNPCVMTPDSRYGDVQKPAQGLTAKPHAILVDQSGVRYMNEACSYMEYCQNMLKRNDAVPSWAVFDSQYIEKYMLAGSMPGKKKPQSWFDEGYLKTADSVEALAGQIAVAPETLKATVERFNGFVDKNCDEDFHRGEREYATWLGDKLHKPSTSLGKIERGPFYAMAVYPGDVGTYGGVVTDEHARVLREDGSVIPGLYATGISTASVMGHVYPGAGCGVGPSFTWGYVAAKHVLASA